MQGARDAHLGPPTAGGAVPVTEERNRSQASHMGDAALLIEFERAEREFVALTVALQERVTSLGAPPCNTEAAQAEQRSLKTELCAAKQLLYGDIRAQHCRAHAD